MDLSNLVNNKLFLSYLGAAGQDISSNGKTHALADTTKNIIAAQSYKKQQDNYLKMLSGMLGGQHIPTGASITHNDKGTTISVPHTALGSILGGSDSNNTQSLNSLPSPVGHASDASYTTDKGAYNINPFLSGQQGSSLNDLAGLTPADLSGALTGAINTTNLQQSVAQNEQANQLEQEKLKLEQDKLAENIANDKASRKTTYTVPGTNIKLSGSDYLKWMKLDDADKTTSIKDYQYAVTHDKYKGTFSKWVKDVKKSGATRISLGDKIAEHKAMSELKGADYFNNPKWTNDLDKYINSDNVQTKLLLDDDTNALPKLKIHYIENKIKAGGGEILNHKWDKDGKTIVWSVKFPGMKKEKLIRYGIRN